MTKVCTKCGIEKDSIEGYTLKNKKTGYRRAECKACLSAALNARYHENPEKWVEYNKKYRELHPNASKERGKKWRSLNKESRYKAHKIWSQQNKELKVKINRKYRWCKKYGPEYGPLLLQIKDLTDKLKEQEKEDNEKEIKASDSTKTV